MKCKNYLKLGFHLGSKKVKFKKALVPRSYHGECLLNLQRLKAHYHRLRNGYVKRLIRKLKHRKVKNLHLELISNLESRLDSTILKAGLARSHAEASQLVSHRHVSVNGSRVNIRSYLLKEGDKVEILKDDFFKIETSVSYLKVEERGFTFIRAPVSEEINFKVLIDLNKAINALTR